MPRRERRPGPAQAVVDLLLDVARGDRLAVEYRERFAAVAPMWDSFVEHATAHAFMRLAACVLEDVVPPGSQCRGMMAAVASGARAKHAARKNEALTVVQALNEGGVCHLVLKGVYLAEAAYPAPGMRTYGDLDILIGAVDAGAAFDVLRRLGYAQVDGAMAPLSADRLRGYERELQHYGEFRRAAEAAVGGTYSVDVHHRLSTSFDTVDFSIPDVFERAVQADVDGVPASRPGNEDFLCHLCAHLAWDARSLREIVAGRDITLRRYADIFRFLRTHTVDWDELAKRAALHKATRDVDLVLYQSSLLFAGLVPEQVKAGWDATALEEEDRTIYDRWLTRSDAVPVGRWPHGFLERAFDPYRWQDALLSFHDDWLDPLLMRGAVLRAEEPPVVADGGSR